VDKSGISAQPTTTDGRSWTTCPLLRIRRLGVRVPPSAPTYPQVRGHVLGCERWRARLLRAMSLTTSHKTVAASSRRSETSGYEHRAPTVRQAHDAGAGHGEHELVGWLASGCGCNLGYQEPGKGNGPGLVTLGRAQDDPAAQVGECAVYIDDAISTGRLAVIKSSSPGRQSRPRPGRTAAKSCFMHRQRSA
jgi:hypothetical protein